MAVLDMTKEPHDFWIGIRQQTRRMWRWLDGAPLHLSEISLPISFTDGFRCAVLSKRGVGTANCDTFHSSICKKPSEFFWQ